MQRGIFSILYVRILIVIRSLSTPGHIITIKITREKNATLFTCHRSVFSTNSLLLPEKNLPTLLYFK